MKVNLTCPTSWYNFTQKQLAFTFSLLAHDFTFEEVKCMLLIRFNHLKVIGRNPDGSYALQQGRDVFAITAHQLANAAAALDFLKQLPPFPVRLEKIGWASALHASLQGVPFEKFIMLDNLYQGYLHTRNDALLEQMGGILYPHHFGKWRPLDHINIFYWFAALKQYFAQRWPHFLKPATVPSAPAGSISNIMQANIDTQIRALTKGDITKEKTVLSIDTHRALTELDALAREYDELHKTSKSK